MLKEAEAKGLLVDSARLDRVRNRTPIPEPPWAESKHESLRGVMWNLAEYAPKRVYDPRTRSLKLGIGARRYRTVQQGANLNSSVLERLRTVRYNPPNLDEKFVAKVKALTNVPDHLAYRSGP